MGLRVFATETYAQDATNVRMRGEGQHEADCVVVVVAAGESDYVHVRLALRDLLRDKARALDRVDHEEVIANAFAAVFAEIALPGSVKHTAVHYEARGTGLSPTVR